MISRMAPSAWLAHPIDDDERWWGLSRVLSASNQVALVTAAWGWDNDVPWSWLPTLHVAQSTDLRPELEVRVKTHAYASWLGFTVGVLHQSKWVVPETRPGDDSSCG